MRQAWAWLFEAPDEPTTVGAVVSWWEWRRIPFNLIVLTYGLCCFVVFLWAIGTSGRLQPGDDPVEPIGLLLAPFGMNVLYTLGWLVEVPARQVVPGLTLRCGPRLLMLGLGLGIVLVSLPPAFWLGVRVFQIAGWVR
jgi:hypothetical protein